MSHERTRVCFFIGGQEGGGVATCIQQFLTGIDRSRFDVRIATCAVESYAEHLRSAGFEVDDLRVGLPPLLRVFDGRCTRRLWGAHLQLVFWLLRAVNALVRYIKEERIELVHANYYPQFVVSGAATLFSDAKLIWHWHGVAGAKTMCRAAPVLRPLLAKSLWFIAISAAARKSIEPIAGERVSVVYNGIRAGEPLRRRAALRGELGVAEDTKVVGLVGSLNPIKGHRVFIEAAGDVCRRRDDVVFVYVGGHNVSKLREYHQSLVALRDGLGLGERMRFLGHRTDVLELVSGLDLSVVCTRPPGEGFGLVIIEAMAQEVAVVATEVGAPPELIEHGATGWLVPPEDAGALAEAIDALLSDRELREKIAHGGYEACRTRFDIGATLAGVEQAYANALRLGAS